MNCVDVRKLHEDPGLYQHPEATVAEAADGDQLLRDGIEINVSPKRSAP